ncbi:MAG: hypothetical protein OXC01_18560 [Immundisolibacterales bacterium]|nr:hypothetical protein [Immundisolibacterales bacterium]
MPDEDRKQIGLTDDGKATVARLTDNLGWFDEAQDAGRFACAHGIRSGIEPGQTDAPVETRWSPDLFDPSGEIRALLRAMYPDTTMPIRLMEYLIDEGLRRIAAKIDAGEDGPTELLG